MQKLESLELHIHHRQSHHGVSGAVVAVACSSMEHVPARVNHSGLERLRLGLEVENSSKPSEKIVGLDLVDPV